MAEQHKPMSVVSGYKVLPTTNGGWIVMAAEDRDLGTYRPFVAAFSNRNDLLDFLTESHRQLIPHTPA
jgi:hypothetical protein